MIKGFAHKGLEDLFYKGSTKGIQTQHADKLRRLLDRLDAAGVVQDMDYPGSGLHQLKGDLKRPKMTRKPTHPGEIVKYDYMGPLALSVTSLSARLGISRKTLSAIVNERAGVTPDMALRLSRAFNTSPELWLNLQRGYDLWAAEQADTGWKKVEPVRIATARK